MENEFQILVGNKLLGGTRRRGEDNIKIYLKEIKFESIYWIHVSQNGVQ
jgi:hypothetical protein